MYPVAYQNIRMTRRMSKTTPSTFIIDSMSLAHQIKNNNMTFAELTETSLPLELNEGTHCQEIDVAFDICLETSIKYADMCNQRSSKCFQFKTFHQATIST